jgi:TRAP-type C4-dicarboxylate transport system substrate-binding protein
MVEEDLEALSEIVGVLEGRVETEEEEEQVWSEEAFLSLWEAIKEDTQEALREIAKKSDGYPVNLLLDKLHTSRQELGGTMSSIGHQMRRLGFRDEFERPVWRDWDNDTYMMPDEVAGVIQHLNL